MSLREIGMLVLTIVLAFWGIGAYNRLVRLRSEIGRAYATVAAHLQQRDALLQRWA